MHSFNENNYYYIKLEVTTLFVESCSCLEFLIHLVTGFLGESMMYTIMSSKDLVSHGLSFEFKWPKRGQDKGSLRERSKARKDFKQKRVEKTKQIKLKR